MEAERAVTSSSGSDGEPLLESTDGAPAGVEDGKRRALLIDWGGVLTTNLFASFHAYCLAAEIDPKTLLGRFRTDPAARELLIALETGELDETAFEHRF